MSSVNKNRIPIPSASYFDPSRTHSEKLLLIEVRRLDDGLGCFARDDHFAEFLITTRTRVSRMISKLIGCGYLEKFEDRYGARMIRVVDVGELAMSEGEKAQHSDAHSHKELSDHPSGGKSSESKCAVLAFELPMWATEVPGFQRKWMEHTELLAKLNPNVSEEDLIKILERLEKRPNPYANLNGYVRRAQKQLVEVTGTDVRILQAKRTPKLFKCTGCPAAFEKESDLRGHHIICPGAVPPTEDYIEMKEQVRQTVFRQRRLIPNSSQTPQSQATS